MDINYLQLLLCNISNNATAEESISRLEKELQKNDSPLYTIYKSITTEPMANSSQEERLHLLVLITYGYMSRKIKDNSH